MHPYVILLSAACLVCAVCAGCLFTQGPSRRPNQLAALLLLAASFWAICEVSWNLASDPADALARVRAASLGYGFVGPLFFHLAVASTTTRESLARRMVPVFYVLAAVGVVITLTTPWVTAAVVRTSWGWGYEPGPGLLGLYTVIVASAGGGFYLVWRDLRGNRSPAERRMSPWIMVGTALPLGFAGVTDVILPIFGVQVPRLGTTSFAVMGLMAVFTLVRFGYSFMTTSTFAGEILETLPDGVALVQSGERIKSANLGLARLAGFSTAQLTGMSVADLLSSEGDADAEEQGEASGDVGESLLIRAAVDELECELVRADEQRIPVSISTSALRDREGFPIGVVLVVRDLREVADLRSRLVTAARLAAVGELAAGIAHEINNPIAFVRTNLGQLRGHWKELRSHFDGLDGGDGVAALFREGEEMLEESLEGVTRAADIVRGVQGFSHGGNGARESADLNALLESVLRMAATQLRGRATVERYYDELPPVHCAPQELKQVFLNLIVNAGHAVGEDGTIRIQTEALGGMVAVNVVDDGCGIEPHLIDRIFDPFFTTKRVGDGTGLGLGIAYQIVRNHRGELTATSTPGAGAHFRVLLPVRADPVEA